MNTQEVIRRLYLLGEVTEDDVRRYHDVGIISEEEMRQIFDAKRRRNAMNGGANE